VVPLKVDTLIRSSALGQQKPAWQFFYQKFLSPVLTFVFQSVTIWHFLKASFYKQDISFKIKKPQSFVGVMEKVTLIF